MGVTGLYQFLKKYSPNSKSRASLKDLEKGCAGIDGTSILHKNSKMFGIDLKRLVGMFIRYGSRLLEVGITPVFVFDGPEHVPEKKKTHQKRNKRKFEDEEKLNLAREKLKAAEKYKEDAKTKFISRNSTASLTTSPTKSLSSSLITSPTKSLSSSLITSPTIPIINGNVGADSKDGKISDDAGEKKIDTDEKKIDGDSKRIDSDSKGISDDSKGINDDGKKRSDDKGISDDDEERSDDDEDEIDDLKKKVKKLEAQVTGVSQELVDHVISKLEKYNFICIKSKSEADFVLAHLYRSGKINYVFGDDGDLFVFGVKRIVRNLSNHLHDPKDLLEIYNLDSVLKDLDLTMDQFIDVCILSKTDYTPTAVEKVGCVKAYKGITQYGTAKKFLKNTKAHYEDSFPEEVKRAQKLFKNPPSEDYFFDIGSLAKRGYEIFNEQSIRQLIHSYL